MYLRQDTIKLWEENTDRTLLDINCSKISLDLSPKAKKSKVKINKWDLIKLKSFLHSKGNHQQNKQTKKNPICWMGENICKQYDQQTISKIRNSSNNSQLKN